MARLSFLSADIEGIREEISYEEKLSDIFDKESRARVVACKSIFRMERALLSNTDFSADSNGSQRANDGNRKT